MKPEIAKRLANNYKWKPQSQIPKSFYKIFSSHKILFNKDNHIN